MICQCDCGNIVNATSLNLFSGNTKSCGCFAKELQHQKAINSVVGKRFERLVAMREADDSELNAIRILCQCDCGNQKSVSIGDLRSGMTRSCGCLKKETSKQRYTEDLTGMVFNELTAIKQVDNHVGSTGLQRVRWLFRCSCGREIIAMPMNVKRGKTKSCGHIGKSYAEHQIFNYLAQHNIQFVHDSCPFDDLINPDTNHKLYVDFVITKDDGSQLVIEHQGVQHYYAGSNGDKDFGRLQRDVTDQIKREYFAKNNIPFYETRYDEDYMLHLENILVENGFDLHG